jgi:hypothetical protein
MEPWMIERIEKEKREEKSSQIPLYLPLEHSWLTGSSNQDKKDERGSMIIDYTV